MRLNKLCCLLPAILAAQPALAATDTSDPITDKNNITTKQIFDQGVVTVWGSPLTTSQDSISRNTIKDLNLHNVAEALNTMPGVSLQKSGRRNELQVKVRGFDNRQVPLFFDGIPIYVPYDGTLDLGRFLASDLASIEVAKGNASLLQGPNMMGGAINLSTRQPEHKLEGHISAAQGWANGKDNAYSVDAAIGGKSDLGFVQLSANKLNQDFSGLPDDVNNPVAGSDGQRANSAFHDDRSMAKIGFTPNESDEYILTYIHQNGEKNSPPYAGDDAKAMSSYWQWPQYNKESIYFSGYTQLSQRVSLQSRVYHDSFQNTLLIYKSLANLQHQKGAYSHYDDFSNGAGLQLSINMRDSDMLSFATHWKDDVHREQKKVNADYDRYKDRTWSSAMEYQWTATDQLDVVSGVSYDTRKSLQGFKFNKNGSTTVYDDNNQSAFNWQLMARYTLENSDQIELSFSDKSRFPTLKERYTTHRPAYGQTALVNPFLQPERAKNLELTYKAEIADSWKLETSGYYNQISDAILIHNISADVIQNRNSGKVDYMGFDVGLYGQITDIADIGFSYSYIHSDVKQFDIDVTGLPTQQAYAWIKLALTDTLNFTIIEEVRGQSFSNSAGTQVAKGFAITGIKFDYDLLKGLKLSASVNNLFDKNYAYTEGFMEEGRNYWLGIDYKCQVN